jgi:hypothetical protein
LDRELDRLKSGLARRVDGDVILGNRIETFSDHFDSIYSWTDAGEIKNTAGRRFHGQDGRFATRQEQGNRSIRYGGAGRVRHRSGQTSVYLAETDGSKTND